MGTEKEFFRISRFPYLHRLALLALLRRRFRGHQSFSPSGPKYEDVPLLSFLSPLELLVWKGRDGSRKKKTGTCEAFVRFYSARSFSLQPSSQLPRSGNRGGKLSYSPKRNNSKTITTIDGPKQGAGYPLWPTLWQ